MGGTAIRHSTSCAGRRAAAWARADRHKHSSANRIVVDSYNKQSSGWWNETPEYDITAMDAQM